MFQPTLKAPSSGLQRLASQPQRSSFGSKSYIEELLRSRETFAEDLFSALLDELGFPQAAQPSPEP